MLQLLVLFLYSVETFRIWHACIESGISLNVYHVMLSGIIVDIAVSLGFSLFQFYFVDILVQHVRISGHVAWAPIWNKTQQCKWN